LHRRPGSAQFAPGLLTGPAGERVESGVLGTGHRLVAGGSPGRVLDSAVIRRGIAVDRGGLQRHARLVLGQGRQPLRPGRERPRPHHEAGARQAALRAHEALPRPRDHGPDFLVVAEHQQASRTALHDEAFGSDTKSFEVMFGPPRRNGSHLSAPSLTNWMRPSRSKRTRDNAKAGLSPELVGWTTARDVDYGTAIRASGAGSGLVTLEGNAEIGPVVFGTCRSKGLAPARSGGPCSVVVPTIHRRSASVLGAQPCSSMIITFTAD